jgi:hypothetical protein
MTFLDNIKKNWAAILVIGGICGTTIYGWNYAMAQAKEVARTEVQATVNKEMVDGAKKAAADAVKEQLPAIAKEVAKEVAKQVVEAQKEEAKKGPTP